MARLFFDQALLPTGWAGRVLLTVEDGTITAVEPGADPGVADHRRGVAVPGLPNLHSHAFQRGMAGLAEVRGPAHDTFWTWREVMYRFLARLTPDDVEAIAAQLYVEMLEAGFTAGGGFHYPHHKSERRPLPRPAPITAWNAGSAGQSGSGDTLRACAP